MSVALAYQNIGNAFHSSVIPAGGNGVSTGMVAFLSGILLISSTAGNAILQWAQNTADATNTRMLAGSRGTFRRV